jgi:hypothetical protein
MAATKPSVAMTKVKRIAKYITSTGIRLRESCCRKAINPHVMKV